MVSIGMYFIFTGYFRKFHNSIIIRQEKKTKNRSWR